jgi:hypothetical protein
VEGYARVYAQNALKDPFTAVVQNVQIIGPGSSYRGLVKGGGYDLGWKIVFEVNAKNSDSGYTGFQVQEVLAGPDGKGHWKIGQLNRPTVDGSL